MGGKIFEQKMTFSKNFSSESTEKYARSYGWHEYDGLCKSIKKYILIFYQEHSIFLNFLASQGSPAGNYSSKHN